jgi:ssDNA-binding Zn-finger/Zn-ribbon topoisomerase 1
MKLYNCDVCGKIKDLQKQKKDGTIFYSCPDWQDPKHTKAREDWKKNNQGAPQGTYSAGKQENGWQVIVEHLTALEAKVEHLPTLEEKVDEMIGLIREQINI